MKELTHWYSTQLQRNITIARWGHFGAPVLLFPTAGGDAEEVERMLLIRAISPLIDAGRIKVYSCDSVAGRTWVSKQHPPEYCSRVQNLFDEFVYRDMVGAIRKDCNSQDIEIIVAGASIGAFNAVASLCRHPDVFNLAIGMSGTFDLSKFLNGQFNQDFYFGSPLHFLPALDDDHLLTQLRSRFILLPTGEGKWEDPGESWRMADVLGAKGIPNRVDAWGQDYDHDWSTWRAMLPKYLPEYV